MVDHLLDLRPHRFATPEREIAGQHAPYPIVLGIVRPCEHHRDFIVRISRHHGVIKGLRAEPRIDQRCSDVLITANHPDRVAVKHRPLEAGFGTPARELGRGRKRAARIPRDGEHWPIDLGVGFGGFGSY
jgi:hypothetical protein